MSVMNKEELSELILQNQKRDVCTGLFDTAKSVGCSGRSQRYRAGI